MAAPKIANARYVNMSTTLSEAGCTDQAAEC